MLGLEGILLIAFVWIGLTNTPFHSPAAPAALMAGICGLAAMGVQSASVRLLAQGAPSTNVMTTNTTQFAIDATQLLLARFRGRAAGEFAFQPETGQMKQRLAETARVMIGFLAGVVLGALASRLFGFICIAPVIGILFCLAVVSCTRVDPPHAASTTAARPTIEHDSSYPHTKSKLQFSRRGADPTFRV